MVEVRDNVVVVFVLCDMVCAGVWCVARAVRGTSIRWFGVMMLVVTCYFKDFLLVEVCQSFVVLNASVSVRDKHVKHSTSISVSCLPCLVCVDRRLVVDARR